MNHKRIIRRNFVAKIQRQTGHRHNVGQITAIKSDNNTRHQEFCQQHFRSMSKDTVVFEIGSSLLRVGIAGEPVPRTVFPVSRFPGLQKCTNNLKLGPSRVTQLYTEFFHQLFIETLQIKSREYRVLIIEKFFCPRLERNCILTSLLRDLQVVTGRIYCSKVKSYAT